MIIELMLLLIAVGAGIVFVAWSNTRRRKQDVRERREVEESTGKLKSELERTANEIIGRMENHVMHLENVLDESERNRTQLEGRVTELKKLLKKSEGQSGEIRDLLARLDDAGEEVNAMQRKMDVMERRLNIAMTTPIPMQQHVTIPQMPPLVTPVIPQSPPPITQPIAPIKTAPPPQPTQPIQSAQPPPQIQQPPPPPQPKKIPVETVTPPAAPINPLGPITLPTLRQQKVEPPVENAFDKILEESIAESPKIIKPDEPPKPRKSIVLSPENKQPVTVVEADPVKIEATRRRLTEASAEMAKHSQEESDVEQSRALQKRRRTKDVRKAALDAIRAAQESSAPKPVERQPVKPQPVRTTPIKPPDKKILPERRDLKLETTDSSIVKEMLLSGMSIEEISRETGLGRGAIELIQEMTRRQLDRR